MKDLLAPKAVVELLRDLGETVKEKIDCQPMLEAAATKIGAYLNLDRCVIMLLNDDEKSSRVISLDVVAEYVSLGQGRIGRKNYQMSEDSRLLTALKSGQVVRHELPDKLPLTCHNALEKFVSDSQSKSFVLFPLIVRTKLVGCLSMHYCEQIELIADEIVQLGVILTQLLAGAADRNAAVDELRVRQAEESVTRLSKQVSWERWARQIICKLHATLDRDALLQTAVDNFGRALGASRCLIVRTEGLVSPLVTHEYVDSNISPLGLGRTEQFPLAAISFFRHKVGAFCDLAMLEKSGDLNSQEYEYFAENGVKGMAGAPISSHGVSFGVIIILECGPARKWAPHELDMLELVANQTAVALTHCQAYQQLKDQLFNMNLLGNLTQQLTATLESVSRGVKAECSDEKKLANTAPPLSLRELEVLKLIASGLANREIAQRLFLTESTVELHASRIRKKLKLKSRTALVKFACDHGLA